MRDTWPRRLRVGALALSAALSALALSAAPAQAIVGKATAGKLSPRLAELAKPAVRALARSKQAAVLDLAPSGPGSLLRHGSRVLVDVRFDSGAAARADELRAAGARDVNVSRRYQTVTVAATPASLPSLARVAGVRSVREELAPITFAAGAACPAGTAVSEGDRQLRADQARADFGVDGSGVTVGVLSDTFDQAALSADGAEPLATHRLEDELSGDLPGPLNPCGLTDPVDVIERWEPEDRSELLEATDEGRAMAQVVHDLAPGADIAFASAFNGLFSFAENIERLAKPRADGGAGADVITDDVAYLEEPFFQDGPVAEAVDRVAARGVAYFSAAGNDNIFDSEGNAIGSWEAPEYRDAEECPAGLILLSEALEEAERKEIEKEEEETGKPSPFEPSGLNPNHCIDFDPGSSTDETFGIHVEAGETLLIDLQWAEPWFGVKSDIDAFLLDEEGEPLGVEVEEGVEAPVWSIAHNVDETPYEILAWENDTGEAQTVQLVINKFEGPGARLKLILAQGGGGVDKTEYARSEGGDVVGPTIFGHSSTTGAIAVGAVRFSDPSRLERFSSRGPVTHYYGPVTTAKPAAELPSPAVIAKPDLAATDCSVTAFFAFQDTSGAWRFCGTSAAAPHAAAVAALMREANPTLSPSEVRSMLGETARPVGPFGPNEVGAGLVDAFGAVGSVVPPPAVSITERPPALDNNSAPRIGFAANRPATFGCALDAGVPQPCSSPFRPAAPLADGRHTFVVTATDAAGHIGRSDVVSFAIDTRRPRTFFRKRPLKTIRTRTGRARAVFRFGSNESHVAFSCRVDKGRYRECVRRLSRRFTAGAHVVRVKARDAAGNVDRTPAVYRFRVKRR